MVDWLENVIKSKVEQTTWDGYRNNVEKHIAPYFRARQMMLSDVKTADLEEYFNTKYKQGLSACYLKKHHANIKKALDGAVKNELIYKNPALLVELPKVKKYRACHYSVEQLETLLAATKGTSIESAVFITVHYGFRRGEALGLRWKDIDFNEKTLTICNQRTRVSRAVEKEPKSETSLRTLTLIPLVADYLKELKRQQEKDKELFGDCYVDSDYVCRYADGKPTNIHTLNHAFSRILKKSGLPHIRLHDLRHSTASFLLKNGCSLKEIQEWLGHADIYITGEYTHTDNETKRKTAMTVNSIFENAAESTKS